MSERPSSNRTRACASPGQRCIGKWPGRIGGRACRGTESWRAARKRAPRGRRRKTSSGHRDPRPDLLRRCGDAWRTARRLWQLRLWAGRYGYRPRGPEAFCGVGSDLGAGSDSLARILPARRVRAIGHAVEGYRRFLPVDVSWQRGSTPGSGVHPRIETVGQSFQRAATGELRDLGACGAVPRSFAAASRRWHSASKVGATRGRQPWSAIPWKPP